MRPGVGFPIFSADAVARQRDRRRRCRGASLVRSHANRRRRLHRGFGLDIPLRCGRRAFDATNRPDRVWSRRLVDRLGSQRLCRCGLRHWDLGGDSRRLSGHRRLGERRRRRRRRRLARRQQAERVDVSIRVGGNAHAEVNMRLRGGCVTALAHDADLCPLRQGASALDACCPELEQRHGVAIVRRDRPHGRHRARSRRRRPSRPPVRPPGGRAPLRCRHHDAGRRRMGRS